MLLLLVACLTLPPAEDTPPSDTVILLTERAPTPQWRGEQTGTEVDRELAAMLQPPLVVRYAECGAAYRPGAARWSQIQGGLRLEFLAGLTWEDGAPVVAADAILGLAQAQARGALAGISARADGAALILEGTGDLLGAAAILPLLPAHRPDDRALSYGPWRAEAGPTEEMPGELLLVAREGLPQEWLTDPAMPRPERLIWRAEPDAERRVLAVERGEADITDQLRPEDVARLDDSDAIVRRRGLDRLVAVEWSQTGVMVDLELRQALAQSVDIDGWLERQFQTGEGDLLARPSVGLVSPTRCRAHNDALPRLRHDPAAAAAALERLGWVDADGDGLRERGGERLELSLSHQEDPALSVVHSWLSAEFRAVGVGVVWGQRAGGGYDGALSRALTSGQEIDPTFGQQFLLTEGQIQTIRAKQAEMYAEQRYLFLYWEDELVALHTRIKDASPDFFSLLGHPEGWKIPPERRLRQPDGQPWPVQAR